MEIIQTAREIWSGTISLNGQLFLFMWVSVSAEMLRGECSGKHVLIPHWLFELFLIADTVADLEEE